MKWIPLSRGTDVWLLKFHMVDQLFAYFVLHLVLLITLFLNDNEDEGLMGLFRKEVPRRFVCNYGLGVNLGSLRGHKTLITHEYQRTKCNFWIGFKTLLMNLSFNVK